MGTTEVQRTLVKSPPELWAELSDQDSLARHLSELGEIRITATVAERAVYWESDDTTGSALIKQAGWGTTVTLRATVATVAAVEPAPSPAPAPVLAAAPSPLAPAPSSPAAAPSSPAAATTPLTAAALRNAVEPTPQPARVEPAAEAEAEPVEPVHEAGLEDTRRGFFTRLFGRRARRHEDRDQAAADQDRPQGTDLQPLDGGPRPEAEVADRPRGEADEPRAQAPGGGEPIQPTALEALQARFAARAPVPESPVVPADPPAPSLTRPAQPAPTRVWPEQPRPSHAPPQQATGPDLSSELRRAEETAAEDVSAAPTEDQVKEILTGMLDRLGAAHHRPFSRA
jgi:hypothetical protein